MLDVSELVGSVRRFGLVGPAYEIVAAGAGLPDGNRVMQVRLVDSGEEVDYTLNDILDDPKEE